MCWIVKTHLQCSHVAAVYVGYSCVHFIIKTDEKSNLIDGFNTI